MGSSVHARTFEKFTRKTHNIIAQQINGQRQPESRVRGPQTGKILGIDFTTLVFTFPNPLVERGRPFGKLGIHGQYRNKSQLQRHHHQRYGSHKQKVAAGKSHPRKGVSRKGGNGNGNYRRRNGDNERIDQSRQNFVIHEGAYVVAQPKNRRMRNDYADRLASFFIRFGKNPFVVAVLLNG